MLNRPEPSCRLLLPVAVFCLVLGAGPVVAQDDSDSTNVVDQVVETIEDLLEAAVDWISGDEAEGEADEGETADIGFEIEPNG